MADWIRVSRGVKTDPKVYELAKRLKVPRESAIGLLVNIWLELPEHAQDGRIDSVPDEAIEDWAGWRGRRGGFAPIYRALFQTPDGRVNAWEKHNGRALARAERDAERMRKWRDAKEATRTEPEPNTNGTHNRTRSRTRTERVTERVTEREPNAHRTGNETRRNGSTGRDPKVRGDPKENSPGGSAAPDQPEHAARGGWPAEWAADYSAAIGELDPGRIGKRCGVIVEKYGAERARAMWRHYIHFRPMKRFGEIVASYHDTGGMGPEDFAATAAEWYEMDEVFDPARHG